MSLLLFLVYNQEKPGSFPGKEDMEKSLQRLEKELEEARREKDKARQELKRLKQHLLEKVIYLKLISYLLYDNEVYQHQLCLFYIT